MHGLSEFKEKMSSEANVLYRNAEEWLEESLGHLKSPLSAQLMATDVFNQWHKRTCEELISRYKEQGFPLYVGQAQKWVNMTLKYIFVVGEKRIQGFDPVYPFCHVPFDNIMLEKLKEYGFPAFKDPWSRIDKYDEYLEKQIWIRERFSIAPLDVEFRLWLGRKVEC